jgi:hypothetical protein
MMKKYLIIVLSAFLLSGCYLIPENLFASIPASSTPIDDRTPLPETAEPLEQMETKITMLTATLIVTDTSIPTELPAETSTPQFTATSFPFILQSGTPAYIENFAHPSKGCDWLGIAGQVFDEDGKPLLNKIVMVTGKIEGEVLEIVGVTGVPEADIYGPGGFEIQIADHVLDSEKALAIQVFNLDGIPISDSISFDTIADCGKNLIIINYQSAE